MPFSGRVYAIGIEFAIKFVRFIFCSFDNAHEVQISKWKSFRFNDEIKCERR